MDTMVSLEGRQLGNYEVIRRIRAGGMGAVYEGKQRTAFDRRVAIKVILGDYAADPDMRRRFAREAKTIARLHHPHILPLIEFGDEQGFLYLVMPYIDGGTLTSYLRHKLPDIDEVSAIYQQLLDAVEYAHDAGLIHRDIKSSNVLMEQRRSGAPYVYLADFGLVRTSRQVTQVGKDIPLDKVPGTPHYMAPEQTRGIITTSTDIYALGVLLYQMLTGELPYRDEDDVRVIQMHLHAPVPSPSDHDASIPFELSEVVRVAMAKRPEDRFKNVAELRKAFLASLKNPSVLVDDDLMIEHDYSSLPAPSPRRSLPLARPETPLPPAPAAPIVPFPDEDQLNQLNEPAALDLPPAPRRRPRVAREAQPALSAEQPVRLQRAGQLDRPRTTEKLGYSPYPPYPPHPPRITEEPMRRRRRLPRASLFMAMIVPAALLILLLMPRVLGYSFFPSGFPVFGTPPVASVYVTPQSKPYEERYILTASPQTAGANMNTRTLPDRIIQATTNAVRIVQTTGTKVVPGTQARGYVLFLNSTNEPITLGQIIITSTTGVRVQLTQGVQVPPRQNGQSGRQTVLAVAVNSGASGNIAPHTLDGMCCNNGVVATNNDSFYGGSDPQTVSVVAQSDLDKVQQALAPKLQQQVKAQLQSQLHSNETVAGTPTYTVNTQSNTAVGSPATQVQVEVDVHGASIAYSRDDVSQMVTQLLNQEAVRTLGSGYQQQGTPSITTVSADIHSAGLVYLNIQARSNWTYVFSLPQVDAWRQNIKGATPTAAIAYLNSQPGVAGIKIQLPFNTDRLPSSVDEIKIVLVDVAATQ